jgi:hypothetical protein
VLHAPPHLILLDFMTLIIFDEDKLGCNIWSSECAWALRFPRRRKRRCWFSG